MGAGCTNFCPVVYNHPKTARGVGCSGPKSLKRRGGGGIRRFVQSPPPGLRFLVVPQAESGGSCVSFPEQMWDCVCLKCHMFNSVS
jgi:hypothetical protein